MTEERSGVDFPRYELLRLASTRGQASPLSREPSRLVVRGRLAARVGLLTRDPVYGAVRNNDMAFGRCRHGSMGAIHTYRAPESSQQCRQWPLDRLDG